jgi:NADH-quinone oxidoreductase subunit E
MKGDYSAEDDVILQHIAADLASFNNERENLIPILQMVQEKHGYIPPPAIHCIADHLQIHACEVFGVASFYNQFRFHPPGKNPIKVCLGTACHVKGGDIILENFERKLDIKDGETTPDREYSIERVACVGCCALAPVACVGDTVHAHMAPSKVEGLILQMEMKKEKERPQDANDK